MIVRIAIPVYKDFGTLSLQEKASFFQCLNVLGRHPIDLVGPDNLDFAGYLNEAKSRMPELGVQKFPKKYFRNIRGYNKLLLSRAFYKRFDDAKYLLIYQLDAWVFSDELEHWCEKGYDFVGAPLFKGFEDNTDQKFISAFNGGLSLRHIGNTIKILDRIAPLVPLHFVVNALTLKRINSVYPLINLFGLGNILNVKSGVYFRELLGGWGTPNEDLKLSYWAAATFNDYTVPLPETAMRFAFEMHPAYLYKLSGEVLPFGCHAWEKYDPEFWKPYIQIDTTCSN